jgi:type II secretory pathway component PulF
MHVFCVIKKGETMPHYKWVARDGAQEYEGILWASHVQQLEQELQKKSLILIYADRVKLARVERWSWSRQQMFFEQMSQLLSAGLLIPHALQVMAQQGSVFQRQLAQELSLAVASGSSCAEALAEYPSLFSPLVISLIQSGEESGQLDASCRSLLEFLNMRVSLRKNIMAALRVPLITLSFFIAIVLILFLAIIPSFEQLAIHTGQEEQAALYTLLAWSDWLQNIRIIRLLVLCSIVAVSVWGVYTSRVGRRVYSWVIVHIPMVSNVYWTLSLSFFFHAVALLLKGGHSLVSAMQRASLLSHNEYVRALLTTFTQEVEHGHTIADAYMVALGRKASADVAAMLAVGTESGTLSVMCAVVARLYFERVEQLLKRFTLVLQPLLMLVMGALVALLIYAVYVPLVNMPAAMSAIH